MIKMLMIEIREFITRGVIGLEAVVVAAATPQIRARVRSGRLL
jgi:hypothetical protein